MTAITCRERALAPPVGTDPSAKSRVPTAGTVKGANRCARASKVQIATLQRESARVRPDGREMLATNRA